MLDWFRSYLSERKQFVCIGECKSELQTVSCGVPQGSVLGPLLFLAYINDIHSCIPDSTVKLFADDTNLFVYGKTLSEAYYKANQSLKLLSDWFTANNLSLNVDKSCYSVFGGMETHIGSYSIAIGNTCLAKVNYTKYLGVVIDSGLSWQNHVEYLHNKLKVY